MGEKSFGHLFNALLLFFTQREGGGRPSFTLCTRIMQTVETGADAEECVVVTVGYPPPVSIGVQWREGLNFV